MDRKWTSDEIAYIRENYSKMSIVSLARHIGVSEGVLARIAKKHGCFTEKHRGWKTSEERFLRENHGKMTYKELAEHLGRRVYSVKKHCYHMGLTESTIWSEDKNKRFRELYPVTPNDEMAKIFGMKTPKVVQAKARVLRVKKASNFRSEIIHDRILRRQRASYAVNGRSEAQMEASRRLGQKFGKKFWKGYKFPKEVIEKRVASLAKTRQHEELRVNACLPQLTRLKIRQK